METNERRFEHDRERRPSLEMKLRDFGKKAKRVAILRKKMWRDMDRIYDFLVNLQTHYTAYMRETLDCLILDWTSGDANESSIEQMALDFLDEIVEPAEEDDDIYRTLESLLINSRNLIVAKEEIEALIFKIRANDRLDEKQLGPLMFAARKIAKGERDEYAFAWAANEILEELSK